MCLLYQRVRVPLRNRVCVCYLNVLGFHEEYSLCLLSQRVRVPLRNRVCVCYLNALGFH